MQYVEPEYGVYRYGKLALSGSYEVCMDDVRQNGGTIKRLKDGMQVWPPLEVA